MNDKYITLTDMDVDRCISETGGFKYDVISALGENVMVKGWRIRLRGRRILRADYESALAIARLPRLRNVPHGEAKGQQALF